MSLEAMVWAMRQTFTDKTEKLLMLSLANYANENGVCWPGYDKLKSDALIKSDTTLSNKLQALEDRKLITRHRRPKSEGGSTSNVYQLNVTEYVVQAEPKLQKLESPETPKIGAETPKIGVSYISEPVSKNQSVISIDRNESNPPVEQPANTQPKTRKKTRVAYSENFEIWWSEYPKREGDQGNKKKTFSRYQTLINQGRTHEQLTGAAIRYALFCNETGKTGTEWVKQTTTFLNNPDNIDNPWTVNHEARQRSGAVSAQDHRIQLSDAILNAPGCESLSPEDQAEIFGERPVQNHAAEETHAAEFDVSHPFGDGGCEG